MKLRANPRISLALSAILLASIPSMGWSGQSIAFTAKIGIKGCPFSEGVHGSRGSGSGRAIYDDPRVAVRASCFVAVGARAEAETKRGVSDTASSHWW